MPGWSATILLLTLATFLDEFLHLAGILSFEHNSKLHLLHPRYPSSSPHARPPTPRGWPVHAAAASPVTEPESQIKPIISQVEQRTSEIIHNGDAHATQTRWAVDTSRQMGRLRFLEVEEGEVDVRPGSNAPMGWADPRLRGGQMLDFVFPGLGEPLNVIISGLSDPYILTPRGLLHYVQTLGFSTECLGIHLGMLHVANLGDALDPPSNDDDGDRNSDGDDEHTPPRIPPPNTGGNKTEQLLALQNYDWPQHGWPDYGTCLQSLIGGNHFRAWKQDGAGARTGAWFLAASREMWLGTGHAISPDGYNGGRDGIVKRALKPTRWSPTDEGIWWKTTLKYNRTLIPPGNEGINHKIFQDGRVAVLTVRRREKPPSRRELWDAWGELAQVPLWSGGGHGGRGERGVGTGGGGAVGWFDWEAWADVRRARWELEVAEV